ncbi:hypothetical protein B0T26DRAFT_681359 [Lasiosphaeria miniovina]|uniref:FAD-binding domain-containing protein n=1 Tax=Lasiosphaeria miniovina TaxID=1954250 RepID=A0AA39ZUD4_9PEZI|nr:uncharacterized protein B0T26DRAFT_681359 [Lasiosphaeria miniovina]KAK0703719.1 hypothetical protein B0T26DRAFT_681359 [Lasiosphaeria miniovina]
MSELYDVVIAGAGPVGLFLACEVAVGGASVLVLERDPTPESPWESKPLGLRGLNTGSVEAFYRPLIPGIVYVDDVEKILTERAESLGVTILRGKDLARQATNYCRGRTLLAGDAAHIHAPLGGQGMNLGWKLAATVRHESSKAPDHDHGPLALLGSDGAEREPIIAMSPDVHGAAVRSLMADLLATADGTNLALGRSWGLSLRYSLNSDDTGGPSAHPCVGCSALDFELSDRSRLGAYLGQGRGLLFSLSAGDSDTDDTAAALKDLVVAVGFKYAGRVDYLAADAKDTCGLRALLIRPDGVVAWVAAEGEAKPDVDAARTALERWFAF